MTAPFATSSPGLVNLGYLEANACGQREFIEQAVDILLTQLPELLLELRHARSSGDPARLGFAAHKIKPSVAILGMDSVRDMLQTLECDPGAGMEDSPGSVERIDEMCTLALSELRMKRALLS